MAIYKAKYKKGVSLTAGDRWPVHDVNDVVVEWMNDKTWNMTALKSDRPCTVFGYKDFCGSTVLDTPKSVGMNRQIDWQAQQISHLQLGRAEVLRGLRDFLNMDRPEHRSTDRPKESGVENGSG